MNGTAGGGAAGGGVEIRVNGAARTVRAGCTLAAMLEDAKQDPRWVVAELNGEPLPRERYAETELREYTTGNGQVAFDVPAHIVTATKS